MKSFKFLEDFAAWNAMALVIAEVGGLSVLGYFTHDDFSRHFASTPTSRCHVHPV